MPSDYRYVFALARHRNTFRVYYGDTIIFAGYHLDNHMFVMDSFFLYLERHEFDALIDFLSRHNFDSFIPAMMEHYSRGA